MMRRSTYLSFVLPLSLAACGEEPDTSAETARAAPGTPIGTDAEVAADADLANRAAQAEAQDAAIGGTVGPIDVSAAPGVTANGQ